MKRQSLLFSATAFTLAMCIPSLISADLTMTIVERIMQNQAQQRDAIMGMEFLANSVFREMDAKGNIKKEMLIVLNSGVPDSLFMEDE